MRLMISGERNLRQRHIRKERYVPGVTFSAKILTLQVSALKNLTRRATPIIPEKTVKGASEMLLPTLWSSSFSSGLCCCLFLLPVSVWQPFFQCLLLSYYVYMVDFLCPGLQASVHHGSLLVALHAAQVSPYQCPSSMLWSSCSPVFALPSMLQVCHKPLVRERHFGTFLKDHH